MISGRSSESVYAPGEARTPGHSSSVTHAPPTMSRRSKTSTSSPARARYAAATRPLWPAPMTTASSTVSDPIRKKQESRARLAVERCARRRRETSIDLERLCLPVALHRRQPLLRLDDRRGTSPRGAQQRKGEPIHEPAPARSARVHEADGRPLGSNARGGPDQAPEPLAEAPADPCRRGHILTADRRCQAEPPGRRPSHDRCLCSWWRADDGGALRRLAVASTRRRSARPDRSEE